jgi:DNA gyrase inhibitor GyrI
MIGEESTSPSLDVRIVQLQSLRVASAYGFGASPESQAWQNLLNWARAEGLTDRPAYRFFGFNNPSPSVGSPNYGYEQWMTVDEKVAGGGPITIKDFPGGLYAVMRCTGLEHIQATWAQLAAWAEARGYRMGHHQWLEECFTPEAERLEDYVFDLYLPLAAGA